MATTTGIRLNDDPTKETVDRRSALRRFGWKAAAIAAAVAATAGGSETAEAQVLADSDILNFALNLEYLEAEFYLRAVTGQGLQASDTTGSGTLGTVSGGSAVPFQSTAIQQYAQVLAVDEQAHVRFLRAVLGSAAVARPAIEFTNAFTNLAIAAGLIVAGQTFNPFANDVSFLVGAYVFEDVGVTAYAGAARYLSNPNYVEAAGAILATEAYHGGAIRSLLADLGGGAAANAISALRATLSGAVNDVGIIIPGDSFNFVPADSNALAFRRSPAQVLNIVYGNVNTTPGLFFPNRTNGTIG